VAYLQLLGFEQIPGVSAEWLEAINSGRSFCDSCPAGFAVPNIIALRQYVKDTNEMKQESLRQGVASRRPFVSIANGKERVWLMNSGPGIAYNVNWQFNHHEKFGGFVKPEHVR